MNWRGRPLTSHEVVVNLIGATTNNKGLKVYARLDDGEYPAKIRVSDDAISLIIYASLGGVSSFQAIRSVRRRGSDVVPIPRRT